MTYFLKYGWISFFMVILVPLTFSSVSNRVAQPTPGKTKKFNTAGYPLVAPSLFMDNDGDGIPDDIDQDDDNDGVTDLEEAGSINPDPATCNGNLLNFSTYIEESGNGDAVFDAGEVYRFPNVTTSPDVVDALITITSLTNAVIVNLDETTVGFPEAFQPTMIFSGTGTPSAGFRIAFVDGGTNDVRLIESFGGIVNDVDGTVASKEAHTVWNSGVYAIDQPTNIEANDLGNGQVQYSATGITEQAGIGTDPFYQGFFQNNHVESVDFAFQMIRTIATDEFREFSLHVDECSLAAFNNPQIVIDVSRAPDTDNDGVIDMYDLDSDNDGIYDAVEAGHRLPIDATGRVIGAVSGDGVIDALQNPGEENGGLINYTERDSDGDFNPDRIEWDSDNDGFSDVIEAGFTDAVPPALPDNMLGSLSPPEVNPSTGVVISGDNGEGYTLPQDCDGNDLYNFQEFDSDGDLNGEPDRCQDLYGDGVPDELDADDDDDGIWDNQEHGAEQPLGDHDGDLIFNAYDSDYPGFTDSNGDGINDNFDTDLDGLIPSRDLDSDGDGIPDNLEAQETDAYIPPSGSFDAQGLDLSYPSSLIPVDTDGDLSPDFLDMDSDNEGDNDTTEAGITLSFLDDDGDGLDNAVDATDGFGSVNGIFTDIRSFPDVVFPGGDVDYRDDTLAPDESPIAVDDELTVLQNSTSVKANRVNVASNDMIGANGGDGDDFDMMAMPAHGTLFEVADGLFEYIPDPDYVGDDLFSYSITDVDGDSDIGLVNIMVLGDFDADGVQDDLDQDKDNDGIPDVVENGGPVDGPGILADLDGDGIPNFLDLDSDGDGVLDADEAGHGLPHVDGQLQGDQGDNGLLNGVESPEDSGEINYTLMDSDGDGAPDYLDPDDDNDGVNTFYEDPDGDGMPINDDTDQDGTPDYLDVDDDGDGLLTEEENPNPDGDGNPGTGDSQDSDNDGIYDYLDADDDNDGVPTAEEDLNGDGDLFNDDSNNNGIPDFLDDALDNDQVVTQIESFDLDGDGIDDFRENNNRDHFIEHGVEVYNAITPNGDGEHEFLVIRGLEDKVYSELRVYNRWGIEVFRTEDYGKYNNYFTGLSEARTNLNRKELLPPGTYFYVLTYQTRNGITKRLVDYLYINR